MRTHGSCGLAAMPGATSRGRTRVSAARGRVAGLAAALLLAGGAAAQDVTPVEPPAPNAVYLELLGNALLWSVNYDRRFSPVAGARVGIGGLGAAGAAPLTFNFMPGTGSHRFELAAGPLLVFAPGDLADEQGELVEDPEAGFTLLGTGTVGYRFQPPGGGFVFRIGFTPVFSFTGLLPWAGISFGYAF